MVRSEIIIATTSGGGGGGVGVGVGGWVVRRGGGGGEGGDGEFEVPAVSGEDLSAEVGIFQTGDRLEIRQFIRHICHVFFFFFNNLLVRFVTTCKSETTQHSTQTTLSRNLLDLNYTEEEEEEARFYQSIELNSSSTTYSSHFLYRHSPSRLFCVVGLNYNSALSTAPAS